MRLFLVTIALMLVGTPALAETLIGTLTQSANKLFQTAPVPTQMVFGVSSDSPSIVLGGIGGNYTTSDVGHTFHISQVELAELNTAVMRADAKFTLATFEDVIFRDLDEIWSHPAATMHVPRLGPGLTGYIVTDVAQTVDSINWFMVNTSLVGEARQTVRIYGVTVPEPATWSLVIIAAGCHLVRRIRG